MNWKTKALIQKLLSKLPGGKSAYYFAHRSFGSIKNFTVDSRIQQGARLLEGMTAAGVTIKNKTCLEIGTGWAPALPLFFWILGQKKCFCFDQSRLMRDSFVTECAKQLSHLADKNLGLLSRFALDHEIEKKKGILENALEAGAGALLEACGIDYRAPTDARATSLADASVDCVFSNTTLEHISEPDLRRIFTEARRILSPDGFMAHLIDPGDHFSHSDPGISPINFLKFSEKEFARYNNYFCWQNRLRAGDYKKLFEDCGFRIVYWASSPNKKSLAALPNLKIDGAFARLSREEICSGTITVIAKKE